MVITVLCKVDVDDKLNSPEVFPYLYTQRRGERFKCW